ncbi:MAG: adenylate/guanylate cyclase domain-containing protein [Pseudomonadota bacterium]
MVEQPAQQSKVELIGPARFIRIGHAPGDSFAQRQSKSIVSAVLIFIILAAAAFLLDPGRTPFIHAIDAFAIAACLVTLAVLHRTKSLSLAFTVICAVSVFLIVVFHTVVGNRGADLILPIVFPLLAIVTIGPRASRVWLLVFCLSLIFVWGVEAYLPHWTHPWLVTAHNPAGWVFHAPGKNALDGTALTTTLMGAALTYGIVYFAYTQMLHSRNVVARQRVELAKAYAKSEDLLRNILPLSVAERLKEDPHTTIADDLDDVVILIADIVDFTKTAAAMPAADVVALLNEVFSAFDALVAQQGLEKIKTAGDAYMVAAGIGGRSATDLDRMADLALAMQTAANTVRAREDRDLQVRIGLHSGLATAGVVGTLKFYYDIWGDTVNLAARLQSAARPGTVRVSQEVFSALKDRYRFNPSGETELKGKGRVRSYELLGRLNG